jgi:hypothetical protein
MPPDPEVRCCLGLYSGHHTQAPAIAEGYEAGGARYGGNKAHIRIAGLGPSLGLLLAFLGG